MRQLALSFLLLGAGCSPATALEYTPPRRTYELPEPTAAPGTAAAPGSLWRADAPAATLFGDARAFRANDILVVEIEEKADAQRATDTDLTHDSSADAKIDAFLGLLSHLEGTGLDPSLAGSLSTSFRGRGTTARSERLEATVPAVVRKVLPNGNLYVEGHRVVLVNDEAQHFYISGVVRPIDIDQDNRIASGRVADARIEFTGRGVLTENQRQGWFTRLLAMLWPF